MKGSEWEASLQPLLNGDIRSLKEGEDTGNSEGRRTLSWIWSAEQRDAAELNEGMNEGKVCRLIYHAVRPASLCGYISYSTDET